MEKTGHEIFNERIKQNKWPIYNKTPQLLNVKEGKMLFFILREVVKKDKALLGVQKSKKLLILKVLILIQIKNSNKFCFMLSLKI